MKKYRNNTSTARNLESAFADEAMSHVKYITWGEQAEREGYPEIAICYRNAARNELAHAREWMSEMGMPQSMGERLRASAEMEAAGEREYINFASDAENEGFDQLKNKFLDTAKVEKAHSQSFAEMHDRLSSGEMFVSPDCKTHWMCYNCGYNSEGESPPERCPLCGRPETWFIPQNRN